MKRILIFALSLSLLLCLTACGSKMPYDLEGTASVKIHAYDNESAEPVAEFVVKGEVATEADDSYTSHNTKLLDVDGTVEKILTTDYVKEALGK